METDDLHKERQNIESEVEKTLKTTITEGVVGGVTERLTKEGLVKLATLITTVAVGVAI